MVCNLTKTSTLGEKFTHKQGNKGVHLCCDRSGRNSMDIARMSRTGPYFFSYFVYYLCLFSLFWAFLLIKEW